MNVLSQLILSRRLLSLVIFCCWLSKAVPAQTKEDFAVSIPLRIEQGLMFTDVTIDGEVYNFLIDTGAPVVLSPELAEKVGFKSAFTGTMGSSNSLTGTTELGTIPHPVELGGLKFRGLRVYVTDYNANTQIVRCLGFDGIIGANMMSTAIWHFDHDEQQLLITNQLKKVPGLKSSWKTKMKKLGPAKKPHIKVTLGGQKINRVLFDTGYGGFFDLPLDHYQMARQSGKIAQDYLVLEGYGTMSEGAFGAEDTTGYFIEAPSLTIGKERMEVPVFELSHTDDYKLGVEYLSGRLVTFDFMHNRLYVYEKEAPYVPANYQDYLVTVTLQNSTIRIGALFGEIRNSSELMIGDEVVAAGDRSFGSGDSCEDVMWLRTRLSEGTDPLQLTLKRDGEIHKVTLVKRTLFED